MTTYTPYPSVDPNPDFVALEKDILRYWEENGVFEASVENRAARTADGKNNAYVFYDGPPFANGSPHYGHLLTGYVKDLVARYQTITGKRVERRFGWDCHGLPAEMAAEKALGVSGRQQIIEHGIGKFNDWCRGMVNSLAGPHGVWKDYVSRQARWVDMVHDYKTMDINFMESVIWAFKQLYDKGLIYESYRVMPYSWAAETPLSNFEIRLDNATREKEDKAITVAFELNEKPAGAPDADKYYILAWTTTPWTLPSNLALAVSEEMEYGFAVLESLKTNKRLCFIASKKAFDSDAPKPLLNITEVANISKVLFGHEGDCNLNFLDEGLCIAGSALINITYKPLFPYFAEQHPETSFRILDGSSFIEEGSGTGVVHMAPAFGEDDQKVCEANGITLVCPVDEKGCYTDEIFDLPDLKLRGLNVIADTRKDTAEPYKDEQLKKYGLANLRIIQWLKEHGALIKQEDFKHNYPHCWRTDQPIIYRALPSWYVKVTQFRDRAVELNKQINWIPANVRDGAMGHMLATAPDWSISRNRFWGTPIPIWRSDNPDNKQLYVFGSIAELETFFGQKVEDLHRPFIDNLTKPDPMNPKYTIRRVEEVLDCWFESGSMPFAQVHYPFENKEWFEENFPADFITEYIGQTRGWFNTLIMLSTALFDKIPFRNCICHGVVIDEETGLKYSKRLKNYKDPMEVFDKFGGDALRWMMVSSGVMRGADIGVDPEGKFIRDVVRLHIKPIWNAYNFFTLYANADEIRAELSTTSSNVMDRYILAKCRAAVEQICTSLDAYDTPGATQAVTEFFEVLNNWHIRRNRARFWKAEQDADKQSAYNTLFTVLTLMCRAASPLLPMTLEKIYLGLHAHGEAKASDSVHVANFPDVSAIAKEETLVREMDRVRDACTAIHAIRNVENIRTRQPLATATLYGSGSTQLKPFESLIADECNVKAIVFSDDLESVASHKLQIHFPVAGKRLGGKMKEVAAAAKQGKWSMNGGKVEAGGEPLEQGEYVLLLESKISKGAQALSTNDAMVVLDLNITPDLESEGIARDVIRMIQQARKDAGLDVSDRIALNVRASANVASAVQAHTGFISEQTLAVSIAQGDASGAAHTFEQELDGEKIAIAFSVAA